MATGRQARLGITVIETIRKRASTENGGSGLVFGMTGVPNAKKKGSRQHLQRAYQPDP